jgi:hypothetical protein
MLGERFGRSAVALIVIALTACAGAGYSTPDSGSLNPEAAPAAQAGSESQSSVIASKPTATVTAAPVARPAETTPAPALILPVIIEYNYAPQYFLQWINDNPQYSMIEATLFPGKPPVYEITLTEKTGGKRVIYSNSEELVKSVKSEGKNAILTAIEYKITETVGEQPAHTFAFKDQQGQVIRWLFNLASEPSERGGGVAPGRRKGLSFSARKLGTAAGEGSTVQIGDKTSTAEPWPQISSPPYFVAYRGAYSVESQFGSLVKGKESWQIKSAPAALKEGAEWTLVDEHNYQRTLRITSRKGDELTISEVSGHTPDAVSLTLVARETPDGLALRSIAAQNQTHSMHLSFKPELNILGGAGSSAEASYEISFSTTGKVSEGSVTTQKTANAVTLRFQPRSPDWAKTLTFTSNIAVDSNGYRIEVQ